LSFLKFEEGDFDTPNAELSLVSNGAEVLMLRKDIFIKHCNDQCIENIRKIVQPYPETNEMQIKLQNYADWNQFKQTTMSDIFKNVNTNKSSTMFFNRSSSSFINQHHNHTSTTLTSSSSSFNLLSNKHK
jgi:hypothetical protein